MGLKSANSLKKSISCGTWPDRAIISLDCQLFLWKLIPKNNLEPTPILLATELMTYIETLISKIEAQTKVDSVLCYFDGVKPRMKLPTSDKRKFYTKIKMPKNNHIISEFVKIPTKLKANVVVNGESEFSMFHNRNVNEKNILVSTDSDLLLTTINYVPKTENDKVYIFNGEILYTSVNEFSRTFNIMLNILLGTDFNESIFTETMVSAIYDVKPEIHLNIKTSQDVESAILKFITAIRKSGKKVRLPLRRSTVNGDYNSFSEKLLWVFNYYDTFNVDLDYENFTAVTSKNYLDYIIKKTYPYKDLEQYLRSQP